MSGIKILVIEDNNGLRSLMSRLLVHLGYEPVGFDRGRKALDYLEIHRGEVGMQFVDLMMPEMSGYEYLRESEKGGYIPSVILTGSSSKEVTARIQVERVSPVHIMVKPATSDQIKSAVESCLKFTEEAETLKKNKDELGLLLDDLSENSL